MVRRCPDCGDKQIIFSTRKTITRFFSPLLPLRAGRCASCKRRRMRINSGLFIAVFAIFLAFVLFPEIFESLRYLRQPEVSLADASAQKSHLRDVARIRDSKRDILNKPMEGQKQQQQQDVKDNTSQSETKILTFEHEELERKHQEINQLNHSLGELKHDNKALSHDLRERKKVIAAKDRQIAELSRRLDELKQQVPETSLDTQVEPTTDEVEIDRVLQDIEQWRLAWQSQNATAYLSRYISNFQPSNGQSYQAWRKDRQRKLTRPKTISLQIRELELQRLDDQRWQVVFEQVYRSDTYRDVVRKELVLIKVNDQYLIEKEQSL